MYFSFLLYNRNMQVKVYAKLNLTLNVGERQGEFHSIDSVATSVDVFDLVEVTERTDDQVTVKGVDGVEQNCNTAYKAARAFVDAFSTSGVDVSIVKGIPFGGGLGGSSADAAAVLYCMSKLKKIDMGWKKTQKMRKNPTHLHKICAALGSDVTFMLHGGLGRMCGKGDDVELFEMKRPLYFALTTFAQQMSSREVYAAFDRLDGHSDKTDNDALLALLQQGANEQALPYLSNDLQQAAAAISSYAESYLSFTKSHNLHAVMTGSGSAYYVAFATRSEAQQAVDLLSSHGFATVLCQSVSCGIQATDKN